MPRGVTRRLCTGGVYLVYVRLGRCSRSCRRTNIIPDANLPPLSLEQALIRDSDLRLLHCQRHMLWEMVKEGHIQDSDSEDPRVKRLLVRSCIWLRRNRVIHQ